MSDFSVEWLALRQPADWRARSPLVSQAVADALKHRPLVRALDLAAGTGSNARFLAPLLAAPQQWLLVDRNPELLARARQEARFDVESRVVDLADLASLADLFAARDLVTASALLDLVSEPWLRSLCRMCRDRRAAVLFALTYDGRMACVPEDEEDAHIQTLINRHQRTDKGFGPALGPAAAGLTAMLFAEAGYRIVRDRSDWVLDTDDAALQRALIAGWAAAAVDTAPAGAGDIEAWRRRRISHIEANRSRLIVGHEDLAAFID